MPPVSPHDSCDQDLRHETLAPLASADLQAVLEAWSEATERLRHSHETLREQVRRLSDELETKNRELARKNRLADLGQVASHVAHEVAQWPGSHQALPEFVTSENFGRSRKH